MPNNSSTYPSKRLRTERLKNVSPEHNVRLSTANDIEQTTGHKEVAHSDAIDAETAAHIKFGEVSTPMFSKMHNFDLEIASIEISDHQCKASYVTTDSCCSSSTVRDTTSTIDTHKSCSKGDEYGAQNPTFRPAIRKKS